MPDYRTIYNDVVAEEEKYRLAQFSPGYRACLQAADRLSMLSGRSLDLGCGVGFVLELLAGARFNFEVYGADISDTCTSQSAERVTTINGMSADRVTLLDGQQLPYDSEFFELVTCFDMLEHLDESDIKITLSEIERIISPGGYFFGSVSCRKSGWNDRFGENLHRTVRSVDWWIDQVQGDRYEFDAVTSQLVIWKRKPI